MRRHLISYGVAAAVFLLLDATWLTVMTPVLYRPAIGHLMREDFDVLAAVAFYAIYLAGVVFFVVESAVDGRRALLRGALFGFVCYATYDLTNQATVPQWPWRVTIADLCWGTFVTSMASWAAFRAISRSARP